MHRIVPTLGRFALPVSLVVALLSLPTAAAAPVVAGLDYLGEITLDGQIQWHASEGAIDLRAGDSVPPYELVLEADRIIVTTYTWEHEEVRLFGVYERRADDPPEVVETPYDDASLRLDRMRPGAHLVADSDMWTLTAETEHALLQNAHGVWFSVDPMEDPQEERTKAFTVHAEDQVLLEPVGLTLDSSGDLRASFYESDVVVTAGGGDEHHRSGQWQEDRHVTVGDAIKTSVRQVIVVTAEGARLQARWDGPATLAASAPTITLDGEGRLDAATGRLVFDDLRRTAREQPVAMAGQLVLEPRIDPDAVVLPWDWVDDPIRYYEGGKVAVQGDAEAVTLSDVPLVHPWKKDDTLVKAGAAGAGILAVLFVLWRWGPFAMAVLYSRLERGALLENPVRATIYEIICQNPGINARAVHRLADVSWGTVVHHLGKLEEAGFVATQRDGRARRYYENHGKWDGQQGPLGLLAREKTRSVAEAVLRKPGSDQGAIARSTAFPQSTVSYHLLKLERAELVHKFRDGATHQYRPTLRLRRIMERIHPMEGGQ